MGEIWKKSQILRDDPSTSSEPILFSVAGVHYKVPRNYIVHMQHWEGGPQELVTFKATYPGFEPLTEKTKQCLLQPRAYWPPGCVPQEFWIAGEGVPAFSDRDHFNSQLYIYQGRKPVKNSAGFDVYKIGHGELYAKETVKHFLVINCSHYDDQDWEKAICDNLGSPLPNGNGLQYRVDYDQINNVEKIDNGMRDLIDSFTLKGDKP